MEREIQDLPHIPSPHSFQILYIFAVLFFHDFRNVHQLNEDSTRKHTNISTAHVKTVKITTVFQL